MVFAIEYIQWYIYPIWYIYFFLTYTNTTYLWLLEESRHKHVDFWIILESPSFQTNFLQIKPSGSSEEIMDNTQFQWTIVTGWWFERPPQPEKYDFVN